MGVLPLKKDNDELRTVVEAGEPRPNIIEYLLKPLPDGGIDLDEYIRPRGGPWRRQPPDFD